MSTTKSRQETLEEVRQCLRSVLESDQQGVDVYRLKSDYEELAGQAIPFNRLGYDSLRALLASDEMRDVVKFKT